MAGSRRQPKRKAGERPRRSARRPLGCPALLAGRGKRICRTATCGNAANSLRFASCDWSMPCPIRQKGEPSASRYSVAPPPSRLTIEPPAEVVPKRNFWQNSASAWRRRMKRYSGLNSSRMVKSCAPNLSSPCSTRQTSSLPFLSLPSTPRSVVSRHSSPICISREPMAVHQPRTSICLLYSRTHRNAQPKRLARRHANQARGDAAVRRRMARSAGTAPANRNDGHGVPPGWCAPRPRTGASPKPPIKSSAWSGHVLVATARSAGTAPANRKGRHGAGRMAARTRPLHAIGWHGFRHDWRECPANMNAGMLSFPKTRAFTLREPTASPSEFWSSFASISPAPLAQSQPILHSTFFILHSRPFPEPFAGDVAPSQPILHSNFFILHSRPFPEPFAEDVTPSQPILHSNFFILHSQRNLP